MIGRGRTQCIICCKCKRKHNHQGNVAEKTPSLRRNAICSMQSMFASIVTFSIQVLHILCMFFNNTTKQITLAISLV